MEASPSGVLKLVDDCLYVEIDDSLYILLLPAGSTWNSGEETVTSGNGTVGVGQTAYLGGGVGAAAPEGSYVPVACRTDAKFLIGSLMSTPSS